MENKTLTLPLSRFPVSFKKKNQTGISWKQISDLIFISEMANERIVEQYPAATFRIT